MFSIKESSEKLNKSTAKNWFNMFEKVKNQKENIWNIEKSEKNIVYIDVASCAASAKVEYIFSTYIY